MFHNEMIVEIVEYNYFLLNLEKNPKITKKFKKTQKNPLEVGFFKWVFLGFIGFYWVLLVFFLVFLGFLKFYSIMSILSQK